MAKENLFSREEVLPLAEKVVRTIQPLCRNIAVAGSLRRGRAQVHDAEVVLEPLLSTTCDLEGNRRVFVDPNTLRGIKRLFPEAGIELAKRPQFAPANGDRYKKFVLSNGCQLDLFISLPPSNFFVQFLIRTGPGGVANDFMRRFWRWGLKSEDARIIETATGREIPTNSEAEVFAANHLRYFTPEERDTMDYVEAIKGP